MAMTISCPPAAQLELRKLIATPPPHSIEMLTKTFLASIGMTEQRVRAIAVAKRLPLSGVIRSLVIHHHPHMKDHWPKPRYTEARIAGYLGRTRSVSVETSAAVKHLLVFINGDDNAQSRRRAREFVQSQGATQDTSGRWILKGE